MENGIPWENSRVLINGISQMIISHLLKGMQNKSSQMMSELSRRIPLCSPQTQFFRNFYFRYEIMVCRSTSIKYQFILAELFRRPKARVICEMNLKQTT